VSVFLGHSVVSSTHHSMPNVRPMTSVCVSSKFCLISKWCRSTNVLQWSEWHSTGGNPNTGHTG